MSKARQLADLGNVYDDGALSNRNLIINGAMQVAQRGTSSTSDGYTTVDRWRPASLNTDQLAHTYSQSTDAPSGFSSSFKANVDTAETTLDAGETWKFEQRFEGQDLQRLAKGTSDAKPLTVSFWVKSSTTGTYICELDDRDNTRAYSQAYTIASADTWEYKTLTYTGDTTGTLDNDNEQSFRLTFMLAAGSDFTSGTLTTGWASRVDANRFVGQTNLAASVNNYFQITGVQLEVGDTATPFEHRSYGDELARCQRYYAKSYDDGTAPATQTQIGAIYQRHEAGANVTNRAAYVRFPQNLRAEPAITLYALNGNSGSLSDCGSGFNPVSSVSGSSVSGTVGTTGFAKISSGTSFDQVMGFHYTADAEL